MSIISYILSLVGIYSIVFMVSGKINPDDIKQYVSKVIYSSVLIIIQATLFLFVIDPVWTLQIVGSIICTQKIEYIIKYVIWLCSLYGVDAINIWCMLKKKFEQANAQDAEHAHLNT